MFLPKKFIEDLERIFEAAMKNGQYTTALTAKKLQQKALSQSKQISLADLDGEVLQSFIS